MKVRLPVILILFFVLVLHAFADLQKGMDAFNKKDYATALKEWKPLAEQGEALAQFGLGLLYQYGDGVPVDKTEAVKWFRLSAEQGFAGAQFSLGWMYHLGEGVPEDDVSAYMWLNLASSLGNEDAKSFKGRIAKEMTSTRIEKAQDLSIQCYKSNYKDCY